MCEIEIWKPVIGYEGLYEVSNLGRVRSVDSFRITHNQYGEHVGRYKGRILKPGKNNDGYLYVHLCCQCIGKTFSVHRLVAEAFIPNPDNLPEVNHKDEDKTNNTVWINPDGTVDFEKSNLEWVSHIQNMRHGTCIERFAKTNTNRKDLSKPVGQYTREWVLMATYPSLREVWRQKGYSDGLICRVCNNERKSAYGYYWKYLN